MKKILCILIGAVLLLGAIGCNTDKQVEDPVPTAEPAPVAEPYEMVRYGNHEAGYDWTVYISDASVLSVNVSRKTLDEPIEPDNLETEAIDATQVEPTDTPKVAGPKADENSKVYYLYSLSSGDMDIDLDTLYWIGLYPLSIYLIMNNDGTVRISIEEGEEAVLSYDDNKFYHEDESISYKMEGDFITIYIEDESMTFAPAEMVEARINELEGVELDNGLSYEEEPEKFVMLPNTTEYTFTFTGLKEGTSRVTIDYIYKDADGNVTRDLDYNYHEAFDVQVVKEDNKLVVKMTEAEEEPETTDNETAEIVDAPAIIEKESNPSTGYSWTVEIADESIVRYDTITISDDDDEPIAGKPETVQFVFTGLKEGATYVKMDYMRPWETGEDEFAIHETYLVIVAVNDGERTVLMEKLDDDMLGEEMDSAYSAIVDSIENAENNGD